MTIETTITQVFQAFFFGDHLGSFLGLLILLAVSFGLQFSFRHLGALIIPIMLLIGLEYVTNGLGWHAIIMFVGSIIVLLIMAKQFTGVKKR